MRYAIVIEKAENNFSGYVPDLPGCVATGATVEDTESVLREAIEFHLAGLREDGVPIPQPSSRVLRRRCGITTQSTLTRASAPLSRARR